MSQFFASGCQSIGTSASVSVLPMNIQDGLRDSQESSPTPQFKSINSSVLSFLYGPTLTSICDHSFDKTDLCWQSNVFTFQHAVHVGHNFSSKEQVSFNFMAAVTICSDFQFSSVHFSRSVVFDSLPPHEPQHARPPCPSPTPGVHSNSHPSSP